jgi:hypothetical protein
MDVGVLKYTSDVNSSMHLPYSNNFKDTKAPLEQETANLSCFISGRGNAVQAAH